MLLVTWPGEFYSLIRFILVYLIAVIGLFPSWNKLIMADCRQCMFCFEYFSIGYMNGFSIFWWIQCRMCSKNVQFLFLLWNNLLAQDKFSARVQPAPAKYAYKNHVQYAQTILVTKFAARTCTPTPAYAEKPKYTLGLNVEIFPPVKYTYLIHSEAYQWRCVGNYIFSCSQDTLMRVWFRPDVPFYVLFLLKTLYLIHIIHNFILKCTQPSPQNVICMFPSIFFPPFVGAITSTHLICGSRVCILNKTDLCVFEPANCL